MIRNIFLILLTLAAMAAVQSKVETRFGQHAGMELRS